jgi:sulfate adenylyltransferase
MTGSPGVCIWLTGLSGAGKSSVARHLTSLLTRSGRTVTLLDGDVVRAHLSPGLGFSRADRDANVRRVGFVASEIVRHGGVAVCALISPYRATRDEVRALMPTGAFIEVFVDTPLQVCESRDPKGLYRSARRGRLRGMTGLDDPYEPPVWPEIRLDGAKRSPADNARRVVRVLADRRLVGPLGDPERGPAYGPGRVAPRPSTASQLSARVRGASS